MYLLTATSLTRDETLHLAGFAERITAEAVVQRIVEVAGETPFVYYRGQGIYTPSLSIEYVSEWVDSWLNKSMIDTIPF